MRINAKDLASGLLLIVIAGIGLAINSGLLESWGVSGHAIGSARRMGPGYMPMLVFVLELTLGALVLLVGFFSGPDPLERWTGLDIAGLIFGITVAALIIYVAVPALTGAPPPPADAAAGAATEAAQPSGLAAFVGAGYNGLGLALVIGFLVMAISPGWRAMALISAAFTLFGLLLEQGGLMLACAGSIAVGAFADRSHRPLGVIACIVVLCLMCWWIFIDQLDIRVNVWPEAFHPYTAPVADAIGNAINSIAFWRH